jgi:hypothetical protein
LSSKLLIIIATGDREKALTGLMYAKNAQNHGWLEDVKVVFFGPSEHLLVEDDEVSAIASTLIEPIACKAIADQEGLSAQIAELGVKVVYVGALISDLLRQGYTPMVW